MTFFREILLWKTVYLSPPFFSTKFLHKQLSVFKLGHVLL